MTGPASARRSAALRPAVVGALVRRPGLWPTAARQVRRLAPRRWWAQPPYLPLPSSDYLAFRTLTQYGDPGAAPTAHDVVAYLEWCRAWNHRPTRTD